jgi:hypothetical protein
VEVPFDKTNGTSNRKLPPKSDAAVPWNQDADAELTSMGRVLGLKACPETGENWILN